jgi:hypothetical protein
MIKSGSAVKKMTPFFPAEQQGNALLQNCPYLFSFTISGQSGKKSHKYYKNAR